jgi:undecaprenyl-diphosphatase
MHPAATQLLFAITHMHSTTGLVVMSAALALALAFAGRARWIVWLVLTVQGGQLLNAGVKELFHRARPHWDTPLVELSTYSFPSGHAAGSTVFWGFVCVLAWNWPAPAPVKRAIAALAVLMVALTCLSRVYLGAHYLSDVLAGACEGVAWVSAWALLRARTMRA